MAQITRKDSFFYIERFVWDLYLEKKISSSDLIVYTTFCSMANNETNECFPSIKTIVKVSQKSENTVCASIKKLCELRLIIKTERIEKGENISNLYHIVNYEEYVFGGTPPQPLPLPNPKALGSNNNKLTRVINIGVSASQKTPLNQKSSQPPEEDTNFDFNAGDHSSHKRIYGPEDLKEKTTWEDLQEFWNEQDIIKHKKLSPLVEKYGNKLLKENFSVMEMKKSIRNYGDIVNHKDSFFKYKWNLYEFLQRENGCRAFLDKKLEDYLTKKNNYN